jgi:hypothetical protein
MGIRVGHIHRHEDETGVSGTGRVAEWVEYSDGEVVVHWLSHTPSTNHYRNMKQVEAIHGHNGRTEIVVDWEEPKPAPEPEETTEAPEEEASEETEEIEVGPVDAEPKGKSDPAPKKNGRRKSTKKEKS